MRSHEEIIRQTGENGFHFVDEAAPPALMRDLAIEIIRRDLTVVWWTNIRFEKSFTYDLCRLLKESGCIAISGGLEVASDRLLKLIDKGVTVSQVSKVCQNFTEAGIMVHAYLMYGFPTQTAQETIDSLEVVRQLFMNGVLQSGFWHQFAMTAHSPVGMNPELFKVKNANPILGSFANNDLIHVDTAGAKHEEFSEGLRKSLFNYMHGLYFDYSLDKWFDIKVPKTLLSPDYIEYLLSTEEDTIVKPTSKIIWLGNVPIVRYYSKNKKGKAVEMIELIFATKKSEYKINIKESWGKWLLEILPKLSVSNQKVCTFSELEENFNQLYPGEFVQFWNSDAVLVLRENELLVL